MAGIMRICFYMLLIAAFNLNTLYAVDDVNPDNKPKPLEIVSITPSGEDVPAARQITFKFNRPVVPVGRMERDASEIPINIKPEVKGQWRWIDTSTLALILDEENVLSLATRYEITVKPGIKAEDGTTLKNTIGHAFITERPKVAGTEFKIWDSPGKPVMRIIFNQPVSKDSVEKHLRIRIKGQDEKKIPIDVKSDPDFEERFESYYFYEKYGLGNYLKLMDQIGKDKFCSVVKGIEHRIIWVIYPKNELPENSAIEYLVEPGLLSSFGLEKSIENRVIDTLNPFPSFSFIGVECFKIDDGERVLITKGNDINYCKNEQIDLVFSSPVFKKEVMKNITIEPGINLNKLSYEESYFQPIEMYLGFSKFNRYDIKLPEKFKANKKYRIKSSPNSIIDVFGRTLDKPIDIQFTTAKLPSNYIGNTLIALEKNADTEMPLFATNLDRITFTYDRFTARGSDSALKKEVFPNKIEDERILVSVNVRKMLDGQSGVVFATITDSMPAIDNNKQYYNEFTAQVTPFNVHIKKSNHSTLVWVTDLATGNPVTEAKVELIDYQDSFSLSNKKVIDRGITDPEGVAILAGSRELASKNTFISINSCRFAILVTKGNDIAFLPDYCSLRRYEDIDLWGTTSQGVYKPGDTIQFKIYVRDHNHKTFISAPENGYSIKVQDPLRKTVYEAKDLVLSEFGALEGEIPIPESCVSGFYKFLLYHPFSTWPKNPMEVLVTEYSTSSFGITTEINNKFYQPGDTVKINTSAKLHNRTPYGAADARVTAMLYESENPRYLFPEDSPTWGYIFGKFFYIDDSSISKEKVYQSESTLDKKGNLITSFTAVQNNF